MAAQGASSSMAESNPSSSGSFWAHRRRRAVEARAEAAKHRDAALADIAGQISSLAIVVEQILAGIALLLPHDFPRCSATRVRECDATWFDIAEPKCSRATQTAASSHRRPRRCRVNGRAVQCSGVEACDVFSPLSGILPPRSCGAVPELPKKQELPELHAKSPAPVISAVHEQSEMRELPGVHVELLECTAVLELPKKHELPEVHAKPLECPALRQLTKNRSLLWYMRSRLRR